MGDKKTVKCSGCRKEIQNNKKLCKKCKKRRLREKVISANAPGGEGEVKFGIDPFFG